MDLPTHDLSTFTDGNAAERAQFCNDLLHSFQTYGFAKLSNYGIPQELISQVFFFSAKFFQLPEAAKSIAAHPPRAIPHRGYSHVGMEKISAVSGFERGNVLDLKLFDCKEHFDQGDSKDTLYPNVWPNEADIPGFRETMERYFDTCHSQLTVILEALSVGLGLPPQLLPSIHSRREHELRILHYPAISISELRSPQKIRMSEHTDIGSISLLFQDSVGGLEIEDQNCSRLFHPLECDPSIMILNVGDSLQRWTNDTLRSVNHRVTIPMPLRGVQDGTIPERYSLAFFGKPNRDVSVAALPQFVSNARPSKYEHMTAVEYNLAKQARTY